MHKQIGSRFEARAKGKSPTVFPYKASIALSCYLIRARTSEKRLRCKPAK